MNIDMKDMKELVGELTIQVFYLQKQIEQLQSLLNAPELKHNGVEVVKDLIKEKVNAQQP